IFLEFEYITKLKDEILFDTIQEKYAEIDKMCMEIQKVIDAKLNMIEAMKKDIEVDLFNVRINRGQKRLEARETVRNGTGLTLYSVSSSIYICHRKTGDTITTIHTTIDRPEGIGSVYKQSLDYLSYWDQPSVYNLLKNYNKNEIYFLHEIREVSTNNQNFKLWSRYPSIDLPYEGYYFRDENYQTPQKLDGQCPYLRYGNKEMEERKNFIRDLINEKLKEDGFYYLDYYRQLDFSKEN
ncbi:MAG: hypothetical protein AAFV25_14065, partial [Bacteroidota bacterium]